MKIKVFFIFLILSTFHFSYAQNREEFSILYLLPLQINANEKDINAYSTEYDIYADTQFQMLDFWKGAQLAIEEYQTGDHSFRVIVRDVYNDVAKVREIFNDKALMENVKLIVGPFFANDFAEAAQYAKELQIPIINPFSSRTDFLTDNPFVYKVKPSKSAIPQAIHNTFLKQEECNLILWYDNAYLEQVGQNYINYFTENQIPFQKIQVSESLSSLKALFSNEKRNIIISLYDNESTVLNQMRLISNYLTPINEEMERNRDTVTVMVFPESWLKHPLLDMDFYGLNNSYYFTPTYVDNNDETTLNFQMKYVEKFSSYPNTETFAYQGYDITKYFIEALLGHFTPAKLTASRYSFYKTPSGGFENERVRAIHIKDFQTEEYIPN